MSADPEVKRLLLAIEITLFGMVIGLGGAGQVALVVAALGFVLALSTLVERRVGGT